MTPAKKGKKTVPHQAATVPHKPATASKKAPAAALASLLKPENKQQLVDILTYHVVAGAAVYAKDLTNNEQIKAVEGKAVTAHVSGTAVKINDATVTTANVAASNGVVHIIDTVLLPGGRWYVCIFQRSAG